VKQSDGAVEIGLDFRRARGGKVYVAENGGIRRTMLVLRDGESHARAE
jgi:hypothetical protein